MVRRRILVALALAASLGASVFADVKTEEKTLIRFEGMLGRMSRMFAGKAAKEGLIATVAVKGDRMARIDDESGEIIDLAEEKVYQLDLKKKTYRPLTFEQMRQQYEAAMKKADEQMKELREAQEPAAKDQKPPEFEMDVAVSETGQRKAVAGYDCREVLSTVTLRPKGQTIDQGGGLVLSTSMWLAPKVPAMQEIMEFERRYAEKLMGPAMIAKAQEMATVFAMYPGMGEAMRRAQEEAAKMDGTPLLTVTKVETVAGAEQAAQRDQAEKQEEETAPTGLGGLGGLMGKKFMKKKAEEPKPQGQGASNRTTVMTSTTEYLRIADAATATDVAIPAGFRERGQPQ